jgi:hypothetical protein
MTKADLLTAAERAAVYPAGWAEHWSCDPETPNNLDEYLIMIRDDPAQIESG